MLTLIKSGRGGASVVSWCLLCGCCCLLLAAVRSNFGMTTTTHKLQVNLKHTTMKIEVIVSSVVDHQSTYFFQPTYSLSHYSFLRMEKFVPQSTDVTTESDSILHEVGRVLK
jgi:hypothetical protein